MTFVPASPGRKRARAGAAGAVTPAVPKRREPVQLRSRQRMGTILDVTAALVDELGPADVTTTMIAERAGISVGSIYTYFDDRAAIFNALVERAIAKHGPIAARIRTELRDSDWFSAADSVIDAIVDLYRYEPGFRELYFSTFLSAEMLDAMRKSDENQAAWLVEQLRDQNIELVCDDPYAVMQLYVGIIDKGVELAFRRDPAGDGRLIAEMKRAIRAYLEPIMQARPARRGR